MHLKYPGTGKLASGLICIFTLGACASLETRYPQQPAVPIGSQVQLNFDARIPPPNDRIYLQDQQLLGWESIDPDRVYCSVVAHGYQEPGTSPKKIEPGEFTVSRVRLYNDYVYRPVNFTNTDDNFYRPSFGIDYRTEIHLESANQPHIKALYCTNHQILYEPDGDPYPTRSEIETTTGELVKLM